MMNVPRDLIWIDNWDDPKVQHAVNAAFMSLNGSWDPTDAESRARVLETIRREGCPRAELKYDPAEAKVPRIYIWPEGRPS